MLVTHQATRLISKTLTCAMLLSLVVVSSSNAQDIKLDENDFVQEQPAKQITRAELIREQIAAGEFGPAMATAKAENNPAEQAKLLRLIAKAKTDEGDFDGALASLNSVPRAAMRKQEKNNSLLGGGAQANFGPLIQLIIEQTTPPALWTSQGEDGAPDPTPYANGVLVEPGGVIRTASRLETTGRLSDMVNLARRADLSGELAEKTDLRFLSLRRLEEAVSQRTNAGLPVVETMRNLGGLVRLRYVMVLPEERDIIIGGPAEPWKYNEAGQAVGVESGRPTLQLDDLVTVLRTFSQSGTRGFMCSIDPRPEGMKRITEFVNRTNGQGVPDIKDYTRTLGEKLGMQDVVLQGIPNDSRAARVIVEADYRMKMIGIGKLKAVDGIESFFDLLPKVANKNPKSIDALRWWLTMKYDAILHNEDRTAFEFKGSSVLCQSENQLVTAQGKRVATGAAEPVNRMFAKKFTDNYEKLAARDLAFADLQNVFDLALVAALIFDEGLDQSVEWNRGVFATNGEYQTVSYEPPREVMSVVNHRRMNGTEYVIQVAGGVNGDVMKVVSDDQKRVESQDAAPKTQVRPASNIPADRWWWNSSK